MRGVKIIILFYSLGILGRCGYVATSILPEHIETIHIKPFKNTTLKYGLETLLARKIEQKFLTHLVAVPEQKEADALLEGVIKIYTKTPLSFNQENQVLEYKLRVVVEFTLHDLVKNKTLWKEPHLEETLVYSPLGAAGVIPKTEDEAISELLEELAESVKSRTIEGW
jgi:outer membrane lipopolysaccharide assembly protein LptE/RlpB